MEPFLQVGVIASTHGIKGEVKVFPTTDDPTRYKQLKKVLLDTGKEKLTLEIQAVRFFKNMVIVKFKGMDDINLVEKYKGKSLYVSREEAVELEEDEYFIADLIGMEVFTEEGRLGTLKDVILTGANEVYVVELEDKREVLIPAIRDCIREVDVAGRKMNVHLLDGLLE
jgi:16S rRNA processing protein RimM